MELKINVLQMELSDTADSSTQMKREKISKNYDTNGEMVNCGE